MRAKLTLDDDVAATLQERARQSQQSFKQVVNDLLRFALNAQRAPVRRPFKVQARDLGLREGFDYDNVADLLGQLERPGGR